MRSLCFIVSYFFPLTFLYLDPLISSASTLTPSQSIKDGEILSSKSENFELGFFSPSNSTKNRYVGIWFKKIPVQTIVWVANRDSPLKDSSGVLMISSAGNLAILNQTNQVIWSANLSKTAESPILDFLDSGNLVLREKSSEEYLWQSFDHPSDTLLPGMRIGADLKTQLNIYLTSWKSFDDPSLGDYTYGIDLTGFPEPIMRNGSNKYYRSGPFNGLRYSGLLEVDKRGSLNYDAFGNETEAFLFLPPPSGSIISRFVVNQSGNDGQLQRLTWVNQTRNWFAEAPIPRDRCDLYALCGAGTICDTNVIPGCQCLKGFKPTSPQDWNGLDWSQGCEHNTPLSCDKGDGFVKVTEVKLPDTTRTWVNSSMSLEECEDKCVKNCSCMAYANSNIVGNGSGCAIWLGDLIDIRKMRGAGQNLYIRVAASELEIPRKETVSDPKGMGRVKIIVIIFSVISTIFILGLCIFFLRRRKLMRRITKNSAKERVHKEKVEDPPFGEGFINGKKDNPSKENSDLELNFFDMDTIIRVTNNFSITNMLGQGGFGCVYKGTLENGHEIAIKRLSKNSGQGGEEFKNEVMLIARLQHRNLVRLLGFCTQWEEKILVYEYMKNKSLDAILFDEANKIILDWPKRFNIIMGISRGLLYLHQDSRFRIIHRDLKTSNVLLDDELNPKISDFGMARIFGGDVTQEKTRRVVGTYGYMSPEYAMDGLFSVKSDVFSLGVLLLEVISGKKNKGFFSSENQHNLLGYAWRLWKEGQPLELIDETVKDSCVPDEAMRCIHVGLLCIQEHAEDRPIMSSVVTMLSSQDTSTFQQPKQPGFCFGGLPIQVANSTSSKQKSKSVNHVTVTMLEAR